MIENTSKRPPELLLLAALDGDTDGYIAGMEAQGQRQLVASQDLPVDAAGTDEEFIALGFTFGPPHANDPLFRPATLPKGWIREGSDHAMWSYLLDQLGRRRVGVFCKAAFYDRRADMRLETVFSYAGRVIDGAPLILDDDWCTREAIEAAFVAHRERAVERITSWKGRASETALKYVAEATADLASLDKRLSALRKELS